MIAKSTSTVTWTSSSPTGSWVGAEAPAPGAKDAPYDGVAPYEGTSVTRITGPSRTPAASAIACALVLASAIASARASACATFGLARPNPTYTLVAPPD